MKLHWLCATKNKHDEEYIQKSLCELNVFLKRPPTKIEINIKPLSVGTAKKVNLILEKGVFNKKKYPVHEGQSMKCKYINSPLIELYENINSLSDCMPLVIYCDPSSNIAKAIKKTNKIAEWGLSTLKQISAVYEKGNKYIIWHEVLHLFGVHDCYDIENPNGPLKCELAKCLMQYAPQEGNVAPWPFLCKGNIKRLKSV